MKFIKRSKKVDKDLREIIYYFFSWRILLFLFLFLAIRYVPLQQNLLGGGLQNYLQSPWLWSWLNFDGEHYLAIAQIGYQPLTYFFFPLFPMAVRLVSNLGGFKTPLFLAYTGLLVTHISFLLALVGLWKLVKLDFKRRIAKLTMILVLLFPTAFFFASFYTESIFLALAVWSFYFARNKKWFLAGILGGFSTATRIVGLALIPAFLAEGWQGRKKIKKLAKPLLASLLTSLGIIFYTVYLKGQTGDPLAFFNDLSVTFGDQRQASFVLLPQVFYRYVFKILPNIPFDYFPALFTTWLEFLVAGLFLGLSVLSFFKQRLSYALYTFAGYILPTLSGSFSSLPRYVLILFPAYILMAKYLSKMKRLQRAIIWTILLILLGVATSMFVRGYWVS